MKTVGIVGGLGPESTVDYYKSIIALYRKRHDPAGYPHIILDSLSLTEAKGYIEQGQFDKLTDLFLESLNRLSRAGADFAVLAANTAHIVFEVVQDKSPLPLISIVKSTCRRARDLKLHRIGLLGTAFTMQSDFYQKGFSKEGIQAFVPLADEQAFIHKIIFGELQDGIINPETHDRLVAIVQHMMKDSRIDSVALACTELPLILKEDDPAISIPHLNTTAIHVEKIVGYMAG